MRGEGELVALHPFQRAAGIAVEFRDASWGAFGFLAQESLEPGSRWLLNIGEADFHLATQVVAVRHCQVVTEHSNLVGVIAQLHPGELRLLGVKTRELRDLTA